METNEKDAQRADTRNEDKKPESSAERNSKEDRIGIQDEDHNIVGGTSGNSPTNEQPSGSQNNQWQQDHKQDPSSHTSGDNTGGKETSSRPARQFSSSDDDELKEETRTAKHQDYIHKEEDLENNDQDFRDGESHSGDDQDEDDALRSGM